jgi:hypothetical protein
VKKIIANVLFHVFKIDDLFKGKRGRRLVIVGWKGKN